jgi:hypothetical protein
VSETQTELEAALAARRELGPELEPHVIESFVERIEQRLEKGGGPPARTQSQRQGREGSFVLAVLSVIVAIPITAIALTQAGLLALIVVWAGLVLVNAVYNR